MASSTSLLSLTASLYVSNCTERISRRVWDFCWTCLKRHLSDMAASFGSDLSDLRRGSVEFRFESLGLGGFGINDWTWKRGRGATRSVWNLGIVGFRIRPAKKGHERLNREGSLCSRLGDTVGIEAL